MSLLENASNLSETGMVKKGDLVVAKIGWSGHGIVQDVMSEHPRADETSFRTIRETLKLPHAKVFWTDEGLSELIAVSNLRVME